MGERTLLFRISVGFLHQLLLVLFDRPEIPKRRQELLQKPFSNAVLLLQIPLKIVHADTLPALEVDKILHDRHRNGISEQQQSMRFARNHKRSQALMSFYLHQSSPSPSVPVGTPPNKSPLKPHEVNRNCYRASHILFVITCIVCFLVHLKKFKIIKF